MQTEPCRVKKRKSVRVRLRLRKNACRDGMVGEVKQEKRRSVNLDLDEKQGLGKWNEWNE